MKIISTLLFTISMIFLFGNAIHAEQLGVSKAMEMPIIDAHFHAMPYMKPKKLLARMDKHNILFAGGAQFAGHFKKNWSFAEAMGDRYIQAEGTSQMNAAFKKGGKKALENRKHPMFIRYFNLIKKPIMDQNVRAIGEIFVNAKSSAKEKWRRWKIKGDSSAMRALFDLAAKRSIPMLVHAQLDNDTAIELGRLASSQPSGKLILGHCGKDTTASEIRSFLNKHSNVYCNIAYRFPPQERSRDKKRIIFNGSGIKKEWHRLIEEFPDRFMVGIDDTHNWKQYDKIVKTIRVNFLAKLSPKAAEMAAHLNARRVFNL